MTRIKDASVEDVRAAVDMVDLVSGKTTLRRSGSRFVGRCPFHDERTASFSVDPVKKVYHCFGCQKGGDHIGFVIDTEGLDFVAAVEWLADRYGVKLEYEDSTPEARKSREQRDRLLRLLDDSAVFYTRYLWETTEAEPARRYLSERGLTEETAKTFRVGYAPGAWDRLCVAAIGKGFSSSELDRAGLSVRGRQGPVDRLRARIMFPLCDPQARVRGFGGRQMPGGEPPKYKNSPDGPVFRKSDIVYGLDHARASIARAGHAIVVEGYTDVLALHQAGIENVVASMGTALTAQQVTELKRVCSTLLLAFDADAAGQEASVRGIELALAQGIVVRVVALPAGRDPADVALDDPEAFRRAASDAVGYLTFRIERTLAQEASRDQIYTDVQKILAAAPATVERDDAVRTVTDRLGLQPDLARALTATPAAGPSAPAASTRIRRTPWENDARLFLGMCLALPESAGAALGDLDVADWGDTSLGEVAAYIRRDVAGQTTPEEAHRWAPLMAELGALAAREQASQRVLEELSWKLRLYALEAELKELAENADMALSQQAQLQELQRLRLSYRERLESVRAQAPDQ